MRKSATTRCSKWVGGALALFAGVALTGLVRQPAAAQGKATDAVLGGLGSGERARRARQGLHQGDRHRDEIRVRPVDELCRPLPQRAQFPRQTVRPDHRRQPVDRRRRGKRALVRQTQRLLRQRTHHHGRLHAGDRARLLGMAEEHAELLGAAGHGRRRGLDLSQGLVRAARSCRPSSRRSTAAISRRRRPTTNSSRSPNSSRAARSTARKSMAPTSSPSAARKASPWA